MAKILNIRGVDEGVARAFAGGAAVRGMSQAEYLRKLVELHKFIRDFNWELQIGEDENTPAIWGVPTMEEWEVVDAIGGHLQHERMCGVTA